MRNARTIYNRLKLDPNNHRMEGFGEWEFVEMLGVALIGEARDVHNTFLKSWDSNNERLPEARRNRRTEERRVIWREYRQDQAASRLRRTPQPPRD